MIRSQSARLCAQQPLLIEEKGFVDFVNIENALADKIFDDEIGFAAWGNNMQSKGLTEEAYLIIAKLTAILKVANGLDRSHKQKLKGVRATLKEEELVLTVDSQEDIVLEKGLFAKRANFFKEVYNIQPVIKQKRMI